MENDKTKKMKKKIKIKLFPLLIVVVIGALTYLLYLYLINIPIKNIYVSGNTLLSDHQIIEIAGISDYPSFLKTSSKKIIDKLEKNPYISNASIRKSIDNKIYIIIEENRPFFVNINNKLVLSNGDEVEKNSKIYVPSLMNYIPDTKYKDLIKKINKIEKDIWNQVSEIKYEPTEQDKDRIGLYMNDGNLVYLTLTKFDKLNYYNDILNEFICKKGVLNLDSGNHFEIKKDNCQ